MKIMAIDASTKHSGFAFFEDGSLGKYGDIKASGNDVVNRIKKQVQEIDSMLEKELDTEKIILEEVRPSDTGMTQNIKTHRALMHLQAAIVFLIHEKYPNITIEYLYPSEWRSACGIHTGRGVRRESVKKRDIEFVKQRYLIDTNDDIADAIGIGHAYFHKKEEKEQGEINFC